MASACAAYYQQISWTGSASSSDEEEYCYSDEEYASYITPAHHEQVTYVPRRVGRDGSEVIAECDQCLLLKIVLAGKAVNSFLRLNKFWYSWFNNDAHWKEYWRYTWPAGYIPPEHSKKPYAQICKLKWDYLTWVPTNSIRISKNMSRIIEDQKRVLLPNCGKRKGDIYVSSVSALRYKNGHFTTVEGVRSSWPDGNAACFRLPTQENTTLVEVHDVDLDRGVCLYSSARRKKNCEFMELTIPWNHLGDKLVKLWRLVLSDREAGRRPRTVLLENPNDGVTSVSAPFTGCRIVAGRR